MRNIRLTLLAALAVTLTVVVLWLTHRTVTPSEATWADVVAQAEEGGYQLISTDNLWEKYVQDGDRLLVVDTRQEWEYRTGHIQGAVNFPMEPTWLARWKKKGALGTMLGQDKERPIVFY